MNLLSQSGPNIFVQHKTKQKTIQTWTLSGPDVCLEDPRRLCKEKLLLFLIEAFEHPLKPETKFEYLQFLNICNIWTSAMFEYLQCLNICNIWKLQWLNICNLWTYAIFEYLPLWIFVIIKSILYFYQYIFKCLLNLTELKIIEIVGYWEKFRPLNLFLVINCSNAQANSRFHNKISQICFTRFRLPRYPGKYCSCFSITWLSIYLSIWAVARRASWHHKASTSCKVVFKNRSPTVGRKICQVAQRNANPEHVCCAHI